METLERKTNWNVIDQLLSRWRAKFILPYIHSSSVVADVGCGQDGGILLSIADKIAMGYGFDFNLKTNKHPKENIFLSKEDFLDVDQQFDVITLLAVLEHVPYPDGAEGLVQAIKSKLKEGGVFIMTTPDKRARWILELLAYKLHLINEEEIRDHKHYFNKKELVALMQKVGFSEVQHSHFQFGLNNLVVCKK